MNRTIDCHIVQDDWGKRIGVSEDICNEFKHVSVEKFNIQKFIENCEKIEQLYIDAGMRPKK